MEVNIGFDSKVLKGYEKFDFLILAKQQIKEN